MADSKEVQHSEMPCQSPARPAFGQRVKQNCKRWWRLYLLVLIILVLVIILPIIFVGYPKMAQKGIDDSRLVLISQKITNPTADALNLALTSVLLSDSSNHPQLDAFDGSFYLAGSDTPFATVLVPGFQAINGSVAQITQHLQISNMSSLIGYTQSTLQNRSLTVYLRGKGGLKQGSLPKINVNYNQRIDLVGLNNLAGMAITDFSLVLNNTLPYNANGVGRIMIPNPTVSIFEFGNVTLDMSVAGIGVGNLTLPNFTLRPGNETYPLYSTSNQTAVLDLLQESAYCSGVLPLELKGKQSIYNGQELPYFSAALQAGVLPVSLDLKGPLQAIGFGSVVKGCSA